MAEHHLVTYQQHATRVETLAVALDRLAHRLRQGAIADDLVVARLHHLAAMWETDGVIS